VVLYLILQNEKWGLQQPNPPAAKIHLGWQYGISTPDFEQRTVNSTILNTLSPRWFSLDSTGTFSDKADASLLSWAREHGQQVWPLVGNRFNREVTHLLLSQPEARQAAVAQLTQLVNKYQLAGLNLDFENLDPKDRDAFSAFVAELAASLHASHALLSVDVPMDVGTDWSEPYDYAALGRQADYIVIMAYDEHWIGSSTAGSVSSLQWMNRGVDKILASVSPQKAIVGLPFYTRDWFNKNGTVGSEDITLSQQDNLLSQFGAQYSWDAAVGQYIATYSRDGIRHSVWLEDSRSLAMKYQVLQKKGVAGFAFWYIGAETPDVWQSMQNMMKYETIGE
jgi:spore germination protein YaaH